MPLPPEVEQILVPPQQAVMATLRPDGSPHSVATWYEWNGSQLLLNMDESRSRLAWLRRDPRVALTVIDAADFYRHVSLFGRVARIVEDAGLADIDRLALRYTGKPYRDRTRRRFSAWVDVEEWHGWNDGPWARA